MARCHLSLGLSAGQGSSGSGWEWGGARGDQAGGPCLGAGGEGSAVVMARWIDDGCIRDFDGEGEGGDWGESTTVWVVGGGPGRLAEQGQVGSPDLLEGHAPSPRRAQHGPPQEDRRGGGGAIFTVTQNWWPGISHGFWDYAL